MEVMSGELEDEEQRGPGRRERERIYCVAEERSVFSTTRDWSTAALDPGAWHKTACKRGYRFRVVQRLGRAGIR